MDFYKIFHDLFNEVAITNRLLLECCKDEKMRALLLRQSEAVSKAMLGYRAIMKQKEET